MAHRGTVLPLLLVALMAGAAVFTEVASGERSEFVRRRLGGNTELGAKATVVPWPTCPIKCGTLLPTCCHLPPGFGKLPAALFYCANTATDRLNCGTCGTVCALASKCCHGKCANLLNDKSNCGRCGSVCPGRRSCKFGLCSYSG